MFQASGNKGASAVRQFPNIYCDFEAELGDDMVLLSPGESSIMVSAVDFQRWRKADNDDDVLVMDSERSEVVEHDKFLFTPQNLSESRTQKIFDDEFQTISGYDHSSHELQHLLDRLPAPDAEANSALSDSSSMFHSDFQKGMDHTEEYGADPRIGSGFGNWHFNAPSGENVPTRYGFHNQTESDPGLKEVDELKTLVRAREREANEERAKAEEMERAFETAMLEVCIEMFE
jgi:hypothetical protein